MENRNEDNLQERFEYGEIRMCRICMTLSDQIGHHRAHLLTKKHEKNKQLLIEKLNRFYNRLLPYAERLDPTHSEHAETTDGVCNCRIKMLTYIQDHIVNPPTWYQKDASGNIMFPETIYKEETGLESNTHEYYKWFIEKLIETSENISTKSYTDQTRLGLFQLQTQDDELEQLSIKEHIDDYDISRLIDLTIEHKKSYYIELIIYKLYKDKYKTRNGIIPSTRSSRDVEIVKKLYVKMEHINQNDGWLEDYGKTQRMLLSKQAIKQIIQFFKDDLIRTKNIVNATQSSSDNMIERINDIEQILLMLKLNKNFCSKLINNVLNTLLFEDGDPLECV
jgi:hypothetical protein